jgi:hypothetical protein
MICHKQETREVATVVILDRVVHKYCVIECMRSQETAVSTIKWRKGGIGANCAGFNSKKF